MSHRKNAEEDGGREIYELKNYMDKNTGKRKETRRRNRRILKQKEWMKVKRERGMRREEKQEERRKE